jgi:RHS repeat-associated protein
MREKGATGHDRLASLPLVAPGRIDGHTILSESFHRVTFFAVLSCGTLRVGMRTSATAAAKEKNAGVFSLAAVLSPDEIGSVFSNRFLSENRVWGSEFKKQTFTGAATWLSSTTRWSCAYRCDGTALDSPVGRFNTPDPLAGRASATNPGSWNRYTYAGGDPVNFSDPSGLSPCGSTTAQNGDTITVTVNDCVSTFGFLYSPCSWCYVGKLITDFTQTQVKQIQSSTARAAFAIDKVISTVSGDPIFQFGATTISLAALFEGNGDPVQTLEDLEDAIGGIADEAASSAVAMMNRMQFAFEQFNAEIAS